MEISKTNRYYNVLTVQTNERLVGNPFCTKLSRVLMASNGTLCINAASYKRTYSLQTDTNKDDPTYRKMNHAPTPRYEIANHNNMNFQLTGFCVTTKIEAGRSHICDCYPRSNTGVERKL